MVIAVRTVLIAFLKFLCVFAKALLALLASKCHIETLEEGVIFLLLVTFCTVKPFTATWRADGDLGIENVFTHISK